MTRHINGALLLYHRPRLFRDADTITDHIAAFGRYSRFPFFEINTESGCPPQLHNFRFDAIVLHYSLFASGDWEYLLDDGLLSYLSGAHQSYKVAFFQDEHHYCRRRFRFLNQYLINCVYTCLEPEYFEPTYGRYTSVPKLVSHVPAYVSPNMVEVASKIQLPDSERPVDIGYRARPTPAYYGRGGVEKVEIGERFASRANGSDLTLDISMREEDRLYGEDWYRFVAGCRGVLGTESGTSCVDLEDEVRVEYLATVASGHEPTVKEMERGALGRWDGKVQLRTTSSRHFEAAALRVCQVMYEGNYSGALEPMRHYIPLKKDFSNYDEVLALFRDPGTRRELTDNAYEDLIRSGAYSYERFIGSFDQTLVEAGLVPPSKEIERRPVERALRPSRIRSGVRLAGRGWESLHRNYPVLWWPLHVATRPLAWTVRLVNRGRAEPTAS